jgi:tripartite-type tricarboxylate transporter receptor subunit TctC
MKLSTRAIGLFAGMSIVAGMYATAVSAAELPQNLRIVIGSKSTGGDTYQASEIVARALSAELGINVKVDAVGANDAFKAIGRDARGTTMMIFHDQSYLGHLYGVKGYQDIFAAYKIGPTVAINPGNAYLVPAKSPYKSAADVIAAAAAGTKVRVAIEAGGVSEIGYSALKNAARLAKAGSEQNIVAVHTGSQADKNQLLFDGQADVINGSVQANEQFSQLPEGDQKAMRFIWITARQKTIAQADEKGMGHTSRADMLKFVSPNAGVTVNGKKDFTFDKEFFFIYNKDMSPDLVEAMDEALTKVYAKGEIQKTMRAAFFIPDFQPSTEAEEQLKAKAAEYGEIIKAITGK